MWTIAKKDKSQLNSIIAIIILCFIGGIFLSQGNFILAASLLLPLLFFFTWKFNLLTLMIISILVFFGDWLISINFMPDEFMWLQEIFIIFLFFKGILIGISIKKENNFFYGWIILGFLFICLISLFINKSNIINLILFLRLGLRYYLLFLAIINLEFKDKEIKSFFYMLIILVILQVPVAIVKFFIYGQGEKAIGTYAYHGGTLSTALPLIVIGFCFSFYILYKRSLFYILLIISFISFSIIGGKRGFIFFIPIIIIFLSWYLKSEVKYLFKYSIVGTLILIIALYSVLYFVPSLSPGKKKRTGFHLTYALSFAKEYTTRETGGVSMGRTSTSINVTKKLFDEGWINFLFGIGPGAAMESRFESYNTKENYLEIFNIAYGISGFIWFVMNVGYLGAFFIFSLLFLIMRKCVIYYRKENDLFWRSFGLGMVSFSFIMIILDIFYAPIMLIDLTSMHYFCLSGFIILKYKDKVEN